MRLIKANEKFIPVSFEEYVRKDELHLMRKLAYPIFDLNNYFLIRDAKAIDIKSKNNKYLRLLARKQSQATFQSFRVLASIGCLFLLSALELGLFGVDLYRGPYAQFHLFSSNFHESRGELHTDEGGCVTEGAVVTVCHSSD
jgi:hypothetical protein